MTAFVSKKDLAIKIIAYSLLVLFMTFVTVIIIYPLLFTFTTSFKTYGEYLKNPFSISFAHPENYVEAWVKGNFGRYFINSLTVTAAAVVSQVVVVSLTAFAIGVLKFKGSNLLLGVIMLTMFLSGEMTTIPVFLLAAEMQILDTIWALLFPAILTTGGLNVYIAVNYCKGIPHELREAASIDGASILQCYINVDLPLYLPIVGFVAVQAFNVSWGDFFWPYIAVRGNPDVYTLPIGLIQFQAQNNSMFGVLTAGLCILTLPIIVFYSFFSKYFMEGVAMAGAVKG